MYKLQQTREKYKRIGPTSSTRQLVLLHFLKEGDVLAIENTESLLQRLNLLLPPSLPLCEAHACIEARWFQLVKIIVGGIELLLFGHEVVLLIHHLHLLALLRGGLVSNITLFLSLSDSALRHKIIVGLTLRSLSCSGV